jgi:dTDP-4-dehydrorhamnose 3,5-epimerase
MKIEETFIKGVLRIQLEPKGDERGLFTRLYCENELQEVIYPKKIVQVNHSITRLKGTIRGLHFQCPPDAETKILRCIRGKVFDVAVDLRKDSSTYLKWYAIELSPEEPTMISIPQGCAHGFQTLEPDSELLYFHTAFYNPSTEGGIAFFDPTIAISWPLPPVAVSSKDIANQTIQNSFGGIIL